MMKFIFKYPQLILFFMALSACQNPSSGVDAAFSPTTTANTSTGGTVANTPPILIAAPSSASYIATVVGTPQTVSLSITNVGQDIAVVSGEALTSSVGSAADFSIVSDLCNGTTLLSGGSCTVGLTYAPVSSSTDEGSFVISYQTPSGTTKTLSIPYSGTASLPQAQVASNPSSYSYGSIPQGSIVSKTFVISNNSLGAVTFNAASISLGTGYTVTSDACSGITLSSASSPSTCAITLTFSPAAIGLTPGTLSLVYRNLSNTTLQTDIALQGSLSVSARPVLVGAPGSNSFGNEIVSTTSASSFTLTNSGSATASIQNLQLTGSSAFAITSDLCSSTTLAVGSSCVVGIRYSPSATGSNTGQISVPYQAPDATSYTYTQSLSGAGVIAPPAVTVAPGSWDYGLVAQGASGTKVFTITNPSIGNATFTGASISANTTNYTITSNTCTGLTLNSSSSPLSCAVSVRFAPTAIATSFSSLILNYTNASATSLTSSVSLTGGMTGTLRPVLSFSPSIASFSGVTAGMSASTTLTMANSGSAAATLGTISVAGTNAALFSISSDTCSSASLSVGASCTVQLTYAPVSAGTHSGSLQLSYTAPDSSSYSVSESLSGTAEVASSTIAASPASNDYGLIAQGANASQTFTITNPSTGGITFAASGTATLSNSTQYTITANTCVSKTVSSSAPTSCAVTVRFAPTAVATSFSVLSLNYTNSSGVASASNISLTGGMAGTLRPVLSLSPALTSFASTFVNATSTATLTLTNSGTATATLGAFSFSGTNSAFFTTSSDNCSSQSLTVGSSCTAVLTYAPVATGSHTGTLQMTYAAPDSSSFTVSQALTGTGVVVPSTIAVSPASNDFGLIAQGSNASQTFTITNSSVGGITFAAAGTATLSNSTQYTITSNTCVSKTVSSSAPTSCTVTVRFAPTALATSFSTLTLNYTNSAGATAASSISLTGGMAGTLRPIIYSGMGTYNFGNVQTTTSQIQTITYTNLGTAAAAIGATPWTTTGSTTFSLSNNTCAGQTIAVGGLCSVDVTFTPATTAVYTGTFTIPYTSPDGTALSTTQGLSGTGTPNSAVRPILIAAASSLTYATTSTSSSSSLSITIINSGTDLASISTASLTASTGTTTPFTFSTDTCSSHVLISGASCSVVMQFAPSSAGSYSGYVNFPYTGTSSSPSYTITVPYSATATLPQPVVVSAPLSWDFGTVNPGSSVTKTFTISNSSSGQATFQAATITGGGFSIQAASDNCSGKVITSTSTPSTCTIVVVYTPTNVGSMIGTLTLNYTNASSTAMTTTVSLTGTAAITLRPIVITSPSTLAYGNVNIGDNVKKAASPLGNRYMDLL